jgi:hypothetical protein
VLPYQVDAGGGYSSADITQGLVTGGSYAGGFVGRLNKGPYQDAGITIFGETIDNRPLWSFIDPGVTTSACATARGFPESPTWATKAAWDNAKAVMSSCLSSHTGVLFIADVANSMRLTTIPLFHQTVPNPSNACCYDIKGGLPIFIESMWTTQAPPLTCTGQVVIDAVAGICRHDPGMDGSISAPPGASRLESASAFVLKPGHLPGNLAQDLGGGNGAVFLRIELTR